MRTIKGNHVVLNISGWGDRDVDDILVCLSQTVGVFKTVISPKLFNKKSSARGKLYRHCFFWGTPQNVQGNP